GEYEEIRWNTIRGNQHYGASCFVVCVGGDTRRAFQLRGTPTLGAIFSDNVLGHPDADAAFKIDPSVDRSKLTLQPNRYGTNTGAQLAVGDFDGDGRADVFQATGAGWWYSPTGRAPWHFLNQATRTLGQLRLGDFNGDGRTDVFTIRSGQWLVSWGGRTQLVTLNPQRMSASLGGLVLADFDGDGRTDVARSHNGRWEVSWGGRTQWRALREH